MAKIDNLDVYILGTDYCGSTFLGNCLNAHSEIFHAGEVIALYPKIFPNMPYRGCPLCAAKDMPCPVVNAKTKAKVNKFGPASSLKTIRKIVKKPVIVDGSKLPYWINSVTAPRSALGKLLNPYNVEKKALILARSPFAYFASVRRRENYDNATILKRWENTYQEIFKILQAKEIPYHIVLFEKLLADPPAEFKKICDFIGLPYQEIMLEPWQVEPHSIAGNAGGYMWFEDYAKKGLFATEADRQKAQEYKDRSFDPEKTNSWRKQLSSDDVKYIENNQQIQEMCKKLGYDIKDFVKEVA